MLGCNGLCSAGFRGQLRWELGLAAMSCDRLGSPGSGLYRLGSIMVELGWPSVGLGWTEVGWAPLIGSARLSLVRMGLAALDWARNGCVGLHWTDLGPAGLVSFGLCFAAVFGWDRLGWARAGYATGYG